MKIKSFLLIILAIFLLVGCNNGSNINDDPDNGGDSNNDGGGQPIEEHTHEFKYVAEVEETCETNGNIAYCFCVTCRKYFLPDEKTEISFEDTIIEGGHILSNYSFDATTHYKTCSRCKEIFEQENHNFVDHKCSICGYYQEAMSFALNEEGTYDLIKVNYLEGTTLVIPSVYNDIQVTRIMGEIIDDGSIIKEIIIPDSITYISANCFGACQNVESITAPFIGSDSNLNNAYLSYWFGGTYYMHNSSLPKSLKNIILTKPCLAPNMFYDAYYVENITLAEGETVIPVNCFYNCNSLVKIIIPSTVDKIEDSAFYNCIKLQEVDLSESLLSVGENAFAYCSSLQELEIPSSLIRIDYEAFTNTNIAEIKLTNPELVLEERIFDHAKIKKLTIPFFGHNGDESLDNLTLTNVFGLDINTIEEITILSGNQVPDSYFSYAETLNKVTLPADIEKIANYAFSNCTSLNSINIPTKLKEIGSYAFYKTKLEEVILPDGIQKIGDYAFGDCGNLKTIFIPNSVKEMGMCILYHCYNIEYVTTPFFGDGKSNVEFLDMLELYPNGYGEENSLYNLKRIELTTGDVLVSDALLNVNVEEIILPDTLMEIGFNALSGTKIKNIKIPETVTEIESRAFSNNIYLEKIELPNNLETLGTAILAGCLALEEVSTPLLSVNINHSGKIGYLFEDKNMVNVKKVTITQELTYEDNPFVKTPNLESISFSNVKNLDLSILPQNVSKIIIDKNVVNIIDTKNSLNFELSYSGDISNWLSFADHSFMTKVNKLSLNGLNIDGEFVIPTGVTNIPSYAFYGLSITSLKLNNELDSIGSHAFGDLEYLEIPNNLIDIASDAFSGSNCTINFLGTINDWCQFNDLRFMNNLGNRTLIIDGEEIKGNLIIPEGVEIIPNYAFSNNNELYSVTLPSSLKEIETYAFRDDLRLVEVINNSSIELSLDNKVGILAHVIAISKETKLINENDYIYLVLDDANYFIDYLGLAKDLVFTKENVILASYSLYNKTSLQTVDVRNNVLGAKKNAIYNSPDLIIYANSDLPETFETNWCQHTSNIVNEGDVNFYIYLNDSKYQINKVNKTATLCLISPNIVGIYTLPTTINYNGIDYTLNAVDSNVFANNNSITKLIIPDNYETLNTACFMDATSLVEVELKATISYLPSKAFMNCTNLKTVVMPEELLSISSYAFKNCTSLESIKIPNSVTTIYADIFAGCSSLKQLEIPFIGQMGVPKESTVLYPLGYLFGKEFYNNSYSAYQEYLLEANITGYRTYGADTYYIPNDLEIIIVNSGLIASGSFENMTRVREILFNNVVTTNIGTYAFKNCSSLEKINIPSSVNNIEHEAFLNCDSLNYVSISDLASYVNIEVYNVEHFPTYYSKSLYLNDKLITDLVIPEGVERINSCLFVDNWALESITLPSSLKYVAYSAFDNCKYLTKLYVSSLEDYFSITFSYYGLQENILEFIVDNKVITDLVVPEGVKEIPAYSLAFLTFNSITLPNSLEKIGQDAFYCGKGYERIDVPSNCKIIGDYAFSSNQAKYITISDSLEELGNYVFNNCYNLEYNEYENGLYIGNDINPYLILVSVSDSTITKFSVHEDTRFILGGSINSLENLISISLPENLYYIGRQAFSYLPKLKSLVLPKNLKAISNNGIFSNIILDELSIYSFYGMSIFDFFEMGYNRGLKKIIYLGDEDLESYMFDTMYVLNVEELELKGNTKYIKDQALLASSLHKVTLNEGLISIGESAFYNSSNLVEVILPSSLKEIGYGAFQATGITNINLPEDLETINDCAFASSKLENIIIPNSVKSLGKYVFEYCNNLNSLTLPTSITEIPEGFARYSGLTSINIPSNITKINLYAFYSTKIKNLVIPGNVKVIVGEAFISCQELESVVFEEGVEEVWYNFYDCPNLKDITLPNTIKIINVATISNLNVSTYGNGYYLGNEENPYLAIVGFVSDAKEIEIHEDTKCIYTGCISSYSLTSITFPSNNTYTIYDSEFNVIDIDLSDSEENASEFAHQPYYSIIKN